MQREDGFVDKARYLETLDADSKLLAASAARDLTAPVPFCHDWAVADVVKHVAEVYEHKIAAIERQGERPDPWPPKWPEGRDALDWFGDARERLLGALAHADPGATAWTWWPPNQTAGFWVRRMTQETAVHRVDVEAATGTASAIDNELALDGIDEVLMVMLAGDWSVDPQPHLTGTVDVTADDRLWQVTMTSTEVEVGPRGRPPDATVSADPSTLLLWLWGRAADSEVEITGDALAARRFRARLAAATQ